MDLFPNKSASARPTGRGFPARHPRGAGALVQHEESSSLDAQEGLSNKNLGQPRAIRQSGDVLIVGAIHGWCLIPCAGGCRVSPKLLGISKLDSDVFVWTTRRISLRVCAAAKISAFPRLAVSVSVSGDRRN